MPIEAQGDPTPKADVVKLHKIAQDEEHLIDKLDSRHLGFVTIHQLEDATHNKSLTPAERKTADLMLQMQNDLRYQRLGYLPQVQLSGGDSASPPPTASGADGGSTASPSGEPMRPYPAINEPGGPTDDHSDHITKNDVKAFDAAVTRLNLARDMRELTPEYLATDIMKKYALKEPGKRLCPDEVWGAVETLSKKKDLSMVEQEELEILKATQIQMRKMWPKEPADHNSPEYKQYVAATNHIAIPRDELIGNAGAVMDQYLYNEGVDDARDKLAMRGQSSAGPRGQGTTSDAPGTAQEQRAGQPAAAGDRNGQAAHGSPGRLQ